MLRRRRICGKIYLLGIDREVSHLEDEVGPDDVEDEEDWEEAVEDVVGREHLHQLGSLHCRAEEEAGSFGDLK